MKKSLKHFFESQKAKKLQRKYEVSPYEEEHKTFYYLAQAVSYLANGVSILTGSTWLFSYIYSIIYQLPSPVVIATIFTAVVLIALEVTQRILGTKFFKTFYQFNRTLYVSLIAIMLLGGVSFLLSFYGSFDFVKTVTSPPLYQAPELLVIEDIRKQHQTFVDDAEQIANDYYNRRKYKGRIATEDAGKYQEYLDKKIEYQDKLLTAVSTAEQENQNRIDKAKSDHQKAVQEFDRKNTAKGWGLGGISIVSITLLYICLWYIEYYDFKTVTQYGVLVTKASKQTAEIAEIEAQETDTQQIDYEKMMQKLIEQNKLLKENDNTLPSPPSRAEPQEKMNGTPKNAFKAPSLPIGFFSEGERQEQVKKLYIQHIQPYIQDFTSTEKVYIDKHTVPHRNFKTGRLEHLDFGTVNNRVGIYLLKIQKSVANENLKTFQNQCEKLEYWIGKRGEFLEKPTFT